MNTVVFDGIVREMSEGSTRRNFARLLGGAAALCTGLALGGDSLARGHGHGNSKAKGQAHGKGQTAAEGKKGKKVTICHKDQTRRVKKQGWQKKYKGATLGPCAKTPQQVVCSSWILSGGASVSTPIVVDDDLQVMLNGLVIGDDSNGLSSTLPPLPFTAQVGDTLGVIARDAQTSCRSLSPLWLHCATTGQKRQLTPGNNDGCAPGRTPGTFFSEVFTVSL